MSRLILPSPRALGLLIALLAAAAPLLQAQVRIAPCPSGLVSGQTFDLTDLDGDGRSRAWTWSLEGLGSGRLEPRGDGPGARYVAPTVHRSRTFHIRATDPAGATDTLPVRVTPSQTQLDAMGWMLAPGAGLAGVLGQDWDLPQLTRFPGQAGKAWSHHCLKIHWVDDAGAGALHGAYLSPAREDGIRLVSALGAVTALVLKGSLASDLPVDQLQGRLSFDGIAVRPSGSGSGNPWHVVVSASLDPGTRGERNFLAELRGDGTLAPLAELSIDSREHGFSTLNDGRNRGFQALAMDRLGNLFAGNLEGTLLQVTPDRRVHLKSGLGDRRRMSYALWQKDWHFDTVTSLAVHQDSGELFLIDRHCVRKVVADQVTTVLGAPEAKWPQDAGVPAAGTAPIGAQMPGDWPFLLSPSGLDCQAGVLYIADKGNHSLRALVLATGRLHTLAGDPCEEKRFRAGTLRGFCHDLPMTGCGAIPAPAAITVHGTTCVIGLGDEGNSDGFARFDLPADAFRGTELTLKDGSSSSSSSSSSFSSSFSSTSPSPSTAAPAPAMGS